MCTCTMVAYSLACYCVHTQTHICVSFHSLSMHTVYQFSNPSRWKRKRVRIQNKRHFCHKKCTNTVHILHTHQNKQTRSSACEALMPPANMCILMKTTTQSHRHRHTCSYTLEIIIASIDAVVFIGALLQVIICMINTNNNKNNQIE